LSSTSEAESTQRPLELRPTGAWLHRHESSGIDRSAFRRRGWLVHRALAGADAFGLLAAFVIAAIAVPVEDMGRLDFTGELVLFVCLLPCWILLAKLHGLYARDEERTDHSTVDDITGVFNVVTIGTWLFFLVAHASSVLTPSLQRIALFWLLAVLVVPSTRALARLLCRRSAAYVQNTVIVGAGPVGRQLARKAIAHPEYGLNVLGFVDGSPPSKNGSIGGIPILGAPGELRHLVSALDVERVIVSFTDDGADQTVSLVRDLRDLGVQIDIVPRLYETVGSNTTLHMIEGLPLIGLPKTALSPSSRLLKRSLDIVGSSLGLALLAPLFAVVAIAIKLDSRGPVFFRQIRRGERDQVFRIYKFRTMAEDAEQQKHKVKHLNMHSGDDPRMFKIPNDPRVTGIGALLRRTSIDELPQLVNVLKGEMSLVGPRPLILVEDDHVRDWARKRLELRPGITGLWQVLGRSDIPFGEMTKLDYLYVTNWSLKEDVRLILLTLPSLLRSRNAF